MNIEIKGDSHRTVEMNIHLIFLLMVAKSVLGSSSNWRKKIYLDSEESIDISDVSDTQDPEDMTSWEIQRSTELSREDRNKAAELYLSDKFRRKADFASNRKNPTSKSDGRLSRMDCRRRPKSKREWLIGSAFLLLCKHFGPRVRDEIVSGLQSEVVLGRREKELEDVEDTGGYDFDRRTYAMAFEIQKPALARCFRNAHDYYCLNSSSRGTSLSCIRRYPACLRQLAINPRPDFQILWLRNYPRVVNYFDRVRKGQRTFQQARTIAQELLKCGLIDRLRRLKSVKWAKSKVATQEGSMIRNRTRTLDEILKKGPRLFDVCRFPKFTLLESSDSRSKDCLRRIVGNLLVHEAKLQEDGESLELAFFGGNVFALNVIYAVKNVLEEEKAKHMKTFDNQDAILETIIRSILQDGVLDDDLSNYPWAEEFLSEWQTSMIKNLTLRLMTTFFLTKGSDFVKSCFPSTMNKTENSSCLQRITAELMRVESELLKQGSSLQSMFSDHPLLANCVGSIGRVLREGDNAPVLRSLNSNQNQNSNALKPGELKHLIDDSLDELKIEGVTQNIQKVDLTQQSDNQSTKGTMISQSEKEQLAKKVAGMFDISSLVKTLDNAFKKYE